MVSNLSMGFMMFSIIISFLLPVGLGIYFYRKQKISMKAVVIGALIFIVFSQVLEKTMHIIVLNPKSASGEYLKNHIIIYAIYGAFAAGIFEEVGRYIGFKFLLKGKTQWKDGIAYGIGHGGIESIFIVGFSLINNMVYASMINSGTFEKLLSGKLPSGTINQLKHTLINTNSYLFALGGIERIFAITAHIAMSLIVLYGIKNRKSIYLLYAIIFHAAIDFPAVFSQEGVLSVWVVEGIMIIIFVISIIIIRKLKVNFNKENNEDKHRQHPLSN